MSDDEEIPFRIEEPLANGEVAPGVEGPTIRKNVDAGVMVINLTEMKDELEALRKKKQGQPAA
jgi:hypothetical protein